MAFHLFIQTAFFSILLQVLRYSITRSVVKDGHRFRLISVLPSASDVYRSTNYSEICTGFSNLLRLTTSTLPPPLFVKRSRSRLGPRSLESPP